MKHRNQGRKHLVVLGILSLLYATLSAAQTVTISMVIFAEPNASEMVPGQYPISPASPTATPIPEQSLSLPAHMTLTREIKRLKQKGYPILMRATWRTDLTLGANMQTYTITGKRYFDREGNVLSGASTGGAFSVAELRGTFSLRETNSRQIIVDPSLFFTLPSYTVSLPEGTFQTNTPMFKTFYLKEIRQIAYGTVHYFDTPAFGMIVKIYQ